MFDYAFDDCQTTVTAAGNPKTLIIARAFRRNSSGLPAVYDVRKKVQRCSDTRWKPVSGGVKADWVIPEAIEVNGLDEVAEAIDRASMSLLNNTTLLLGELTPEGQKQLEIRGYANRLSRSKKGEPAAWRDAPSHLHFLDVDSLILPDRYSLTDPIETLAHWLRSTLPDDLAAADMYVQATASHGTYKGNTRPVPRLRAAFWLAAPISLAEWKNHVEKRIAPHVARCAEFIGTRPLDTSIYSPGHYVFVLPPRAIGDGTPYPGRRSWLLEGDLSDVKLAELPTEIAQTASPHAVAGLVRDGRHRWKEGDSDDEVLASISPGYVHLPLRRLMARYGWRYGDTADLEEAIRRLEPVVIGRLREISSTREEFEERHREHVDGDKLLRSAQSWARKTLAERALEVETEAPLKYGASADGPRSPADVVAPLVRTALDNPKPNLDIVRAPTGTGKTFAALDAITERDLYGRRILYFAPNHELAAQTANDMRARFNDPTTQDLVRHYRGRQQPGVCKNPALDPVARSLERLAISPKRAVCGQCPLAGACEYILRGEDDRPGFLAYTHADLTTSFAQTTSASKRNPDLTIIDESAMSTLLASGRLHGQLSMLGETYLPVPNGTLKPAEIADIAVDRAALSSMLRKIDSGRLRSEDAAPLVLQSFDAIGREARVHAHLTGRIEELAERVAASHDKKFSSADQAELTRLSAFRTASRFAMACWHALELHCERDVEREFVKGIRQPQGASDISVWVAPPPPLILQHSPVIILDATARLDLWKRLIDRETSQRVELHDVGSPPGAYHLTQITDRPFSKKSLLRHGPTVQAGSYLERLRLFISLKAAKYADRSGTGVLVVAQKAVLEGLGSLPANVETKHFNSLRGLNRFKDVPCLISIGRPAPPFDVLEAQADALTARDPSAGDVISADGEPFSTNRELPLRSPDGVQKAIRIQAEAHRDPVCNEMMEEACAEVAQAVGRARVSRRDASNPCEIIVFGQVSSGLEIDRYERWDIVSNVSLNTIACEVGIWPCNKAAMLDVFADRAGASDAVISRRKAELTPSESAKLVAWRVESSRAIRKAYVQGDQWKLKIESISNIRAIEAGL